MPGAHLLSPCAPYPLHPAGRLPAGDLDKLRLVVATFGQRSAKAQVCGVAANGHDAALRPSHCAARCSQHVHADPVRQSDGRISTWPPKPRPLSMAPQTLKHPRLPILDQGLAAPITDLQRVVDTRQRLYLACRAVGSRLACLGGLKVGSKKLFTRRVSFLELQVPRMQGSQLQPALLWPVHAADESVAAGPTTFCTLHPTNRCRRAGRSWR